MKLILLQSSSVFVITVILVAMTDQSLQMTNDEKCGAPT